MNKQKVKDFVDNHKKELICGVTVMAVGGAFVLGRMYGVHISKYPWHNDMGNVLGGGYIKNDRFQVGERLTVADLGKLGEALIQKDGHSPDTIVDGVELYMSVIET